MSIFYFFDQVICLYVVSHTDDCALMELSQEFCQYLGLAGNPSCCIVSANGK